MYTSKNFITILLLLMAGSVSAQSPAITVSGPASVNVGAQATYTASFNYSNGPITWSVIGGVITTPPSNTSCDVLWNSSPGKGSVRAFDANNHVSDAILVWRGMNQQALCPEANAGEDKTACPGVPVLIGTPGVPPYKYAWWPETGLNDPSLPQPTVTTNFPRRYTVTVTADDNLIVNGDFEAGMSGFVTDYGIFPNGIGCSNTTNFGSIAITTNPYLSQGTQYCETTDRTPNGNKMLFVDGTCTPNRRVWSQTVNVTPNTVYQFSGYAANASDRQQFIVEWAASLRIRINGVDVLQGYHDLWSCNNWREITAQWSSGSSTTATIEIYDDNLASDLNDFVLDELYFGLCPRSTDQVLVGTIVNPTVSPAGPINYINQYETPQTIVLTATPATSYQWMRSGVGLTGQTSQTLTVTLDGSGYTTNEYWCVTSCGTTNMVRINYWGCMSTTPNCYPFAIPSPCLFGSMMGGNSYQLPAAPSLGPGTVNSWWLSNTANGFPSCYSINGSGQISSANGSACYEGIYTKASLNGAENIVFYYFAANPGCRVVNPEGPSVPLQPIPGVTTGKTPAPVRKIIPSASPARLAPNPATSSVTVMAATGITKVELYNHSGVLSKQVKGDGSRVMTINTGTLPNGVYMCKIYSDNREEVLKLVIQR
jgi:hypothetical protein